MDPEDRVERGALICRVFPRGAGGARGERRGGGAGEAGDLLAVFCFWVSVGGREKEEDRKKTTR